MRKAVIALSIACAGALAFADTAQWQNPWFTGIGSSAESLESLDATNGSWSFPTDNAGVSFDSDTKKITFELDDDAESKFTVNDDPAATAKTAQKIVVKGVFEPCTTSDLTSGEKMNETGAQIGFAVVATTETVEATEENSDATTSTVYYYYAWIGATNGDTSFADWVKVGKCDDSEAETELTITISYWQGSPTATFSAKNGESDAVERADQKLTSTAATGDDATYKVSSVACTGSGSLSALGGESAIAVASVGDTLYGTADAAIAAANEGETVKLLAAPNGTVSVAEEMSVAIDENGNSATIENKGTLAVALSADDVKAGNGEYTIKGISGTGTFNVTTTDSTKTATAAVSAGNLVVTVDTAASEVEAIKFLTKSLMKSDGLAGFRTFLKANCKTVYDGAESTTAKLQTALEETGDNGLPLWQSYVLGVASDASVAVNYASADSATDKVTLSIPALANKAAFGSYTVKVVDGNGTVLSAGGDDSPLSTLQLPMSEAAKYAVALSFE